MLYFKKTTLAAIVLVAGVGGANAQSAQADYSMTVDALPAFCSLTNPVDGTAGVWDLLNYTFTNGSTPSVDTSSRDFAYILADASDDVTGPGGLVAGAIDDIDYSLGTHGAAAVVDYIGGLGDGDAGLVNLTGLVGVTVSETLNILPFVTMDQANFLPQSIGDTYVATFVVSCIES